jgi:predicted patatin/cPLA2 family phospholipase
MDDIRESGNLKVKIIEKRLSEVDNEYLLTKTISNYDKGLRKSMRMVKRETNKEDLEKNLKEINELLELSRDQGKREEMKFSGQRHKSLKESNFAKIHRNSLAPP